MITLLLWILVSFGMTVTVTLSTLFSPLRIKATKINHWLGDLVRCPMCFGFWVGLGLSTFWFSPTGFILLDGFLSLSTCWLLYCVSWALALKSGKV